MGKIVGSEVGSWVGTGVGSNVPNTGDELIVVRVVGTVEEEDDGEKVKGT